MGLLSDPEYGSVKWVKILKKIHAPLSFLCYAGALVWFVLLGHREFNNETYFSENALLPGLVTNEFNGEQTAKQFLKELFVELEDKYSENEMIPVPWLVGKMSQLHLETYTHNFTLNYPMGQGQVYHGTNVYGILRASRAASLEALVVAAPHRALHSHQKGTAAGVALMLAFAHFARSQKYWAKDIIFLVTEHEQLGMQAWLEAYHGLDNDVGTFYKSLGSFWKPGTPSLDFSKLVSGFNLGDHKRCLDPGVLKGRSGAIQAAINLEFDVPNIKYIEVKVEGLNGQLPNLDLVNLVHKLCVKSGIHHSYKNSYSWVRRNKMDEWSSSVRTLLDMLAAQLAGVPNGNHGLFHRFGIEAVTLEGRGADDPAGAPGATALGGASFRRLGVLLESVLRSLNNLLEKFHQSYFFYLLAATNRFVSIGQYMPLLCLLCAAMLIKALYLWVSVQDEEDTDKQTNNTKKPKGDEAKSSMDVINIGANYLLVHLIGYAVMNSPMLFSWIGASYGFPSEVSVFYGLIGTSVCLAVVTPQLLRLVGRSGGRPGVGVGGRPGVGVGGRSGVGVGGRPGVGAGGVHPEDLRLMHILVLMELATASLAVGMHNFALGLLIAVVYTPLALVAGVATTGGGRLSELWLQFRRVLCVCVHPLAALWLALALYARGVGGAGLDEGVGVAARAALAAMQAIMFAIVDSLIYGNWLFNVVATVLLPIWILFWQLLWSRVPVQP